MKRGTVACVVLGLAAGGCRRVAVQADCVVRPAGPYCTFANTGQRPARACFAVRVRVRRGRAVVGSARVCSPVLRVGQGTEPVEMVFDRAGVFAACGADGTACETEIASQGVE